MTVQGVQLVLTLDSSSLTKSSAKEDSGKENVSRTSRKLKAKLLVEASRKDRLPFGRSKKGYCELTQEISRFRAKCIQGERAT